MKIIVILVLLGAAVAASGAFVAPTDEQVAAAAAAPETELAALLTDASGSEAAAVVERVVLQITTLDLDDAALTARLDLLIATATTALPPGERPAFAAALGRALAGGALPANVLATIRAALVTGGGDTMGPSFDSGLDDGAPAPPLVLQPKPPDKEEPDQPSARGAGVAMTSGPAGKWLAWSCLLFLVTAAWRGAGLRRGDAVFFAVAAGFLLALAFIGGYRPTRRDVFFWAGLLFLLYLGLQWWNAGRELKLDAAAGQWVHTPPPRPGLPWAFDRGDAAQMLYWFFPAWAVALCARVPAMTRRALGWILRGLIGSAALLVLGGAAERLARQPDLIWRMPPGAISFASFGYANHAAAYFLLLAGAAAGLLFRQAFRRDRPGSRLELAGLAAGFVLCLAGANLSISRAGVILAWALTGLAAIYGTVLGWRRLRPAARVPWFLAVALVGATLYYTVAGAGGRAILHEFTPRRPPMQSLLPGVDRIDLDLEDRPRLWNVAWRVFQDHPWFGTGGWGFRHVAAFYLPENQWDYLRFNPGRANVHNDPLQFLAEFGLVGSGLLALAVAALAAPLAGRGAGRGAVLIMTGAGLLSVTVFSIIDLPFRCPALIWTWTAVLAALPKLATRGPTDALSAAEGTIRKEGRPWIRTATAPT